ncbi:hypothetical protein LR48_Vigan08g109400 [Vigna angularis]|uniref:Transposase (putative) gypsy type domain-containing protein n=1 Tax=Phaseolus angularis TaxID=3914 RepID=A0A0L9V5N0_PHAAN|nr:hypothetical protein LR48_Vigan08g109400 [Vigna angularis]
MLGFECGVYPGCGVARVTRLLSGGIGGSSAGGDGERGASSSSVSSSFLEDVVRSSGQEPGSPDAVGSRIINGIPIFLLKGGIRIDDSPFELDGDDTMVTEYDWAPYGANMLIRAGVSLRNERVYYGKRSSPDDFFYMYANVFAQLCVLVPFTEFQMVVLQEANIAPTQLHPNSWVDMQAFLAMCLVVGVTLTIHVFFHYFENFKHHYFKIIIDAAGRHEFHDAAGNPLFPFYWTRKPRKIKAFPVGVLNPVDLEAVRTINALPRRISACHLVEYLRHADCERKAFDLMTAPTPANPTSWPPGKESRKAHRQPGRRGSVPVGREPVLELVPNLAAVFVDPSFEAATASVVPLVRKRKDLAGEGHKDKEASSSRSASKKARKGKEKAPSPLLPGGIFSPAFNMSDRTKFHVSSSQRALIEPLSEMILIHDDYDKKILEADLEKTKKGSVDATDRLTSARKDYDRLMEECGQLKVTVSHQKNSENGLFRSNRALTDDLAKAKEKVSELEAGIVFEHEEGFHKALRQASVLAGIQEHFALGFDIEEDVFDGVLVDLNTLVDGKAPEIEGPPDAVAADEAVKVEDVDDEAEDADS